MPPSTHVYPLQWSVSTIKSTKHPEPEAAAVRCLAGSRPCTVSARLAREVRTERGDEVVNARGGGKGSCVAPGSRHDRGDAGSRRIDHLAPGRRLESLFAWACGCKEHRHHRRACLSTKVVYEEEARRRRSPPQAPPEGPRREEPKPLGSINDDCTCKWLGSSTDACVPGHLRRWVF
ncbi:hypothetical protein Purlil1_9596 [Purpureocillium lilacinum]|uniref:Uncharacterized protein n=1 Tax=Purpureocillium lilacinum TaxID=33203 RepID=A0ABR0BQA8_PURLI|nr:hypothetical protein Purlil1_9596 [Purpureocillium lilacinum]